MIPEKQLTFKWIVTICGFQCLVNTAQYSYAIRHYFKKPSYFSGVECQDIDNDFPCHNIANTQQI
jgi:hypothetical protein